MLSTLVLSGCPRGGGKRSCAAFELPLAEKWSTLGEIGETTSFVNTAGSSVSLTLSSREDSDPYTGYSYFGAESESVVCNMQSNRRYTFDDGVTSLMIEFGQTESYDEPIEEQTLSINMKPESPVGVVLNYGFLFPVSVPDSYYTDEVAPDSGDDKSTRYLTNLEVDGVQYKRAMEMSYLDLSRVVENSDKTNAMSAITRVVFAEGAGLVEFELLDGQVFSRRGAGS